MLEIIKIIGFTWYINPTDLMPIFLIFLFIFFLQYFYYYFKSAGSKIFDAFGSLMLSLLSWLIWNIVIYKNKRSNNQIKNSGSDSDDDEDVILEQLKCPICTEIPMAQIYQCRNGHTLCHKCLNSVRICPQCRVPFETFGQLIRVRALESFLESVKMACPHKKDGCKEKIPKKNIGSHVQKCNYNGKCVQLCKLLGYDCDFMTNASYTEPAVYHFQTEHKAIVIDGDTAGIRLENFKLKTDNLVADGIWQPIIMSTNKSQFMILTFFNANDATVSWTCFQMNYDESCLREDEIKIQIENHANKRLPIKWKMFPVPLMELQSTPMSEFGLQRISAKTLSEKYVVLNDNFDRNNVITTRLTGSLQLKITITPGFLIQESNLPREIIERFGGMQCSKTISEINIRKKESDLNRTPLLSIWSKISWKSLRKHVEE